MANTRSAASTANLRVIDSSDRARELAAKSAVKRRARAEARKLAEARQVVGAMGGRDGLGERAYAAASKVVDDLLTGAIEVRTAREAAAVVTALVQIGRSESSSVPKRLSKEELIADIKAQVEAIRATTGTSDG